jgi:hypothetical protein
MKTMPATSAALLSLVVVAGVLFAAAPAAAEKNPPGFVDLSWIEIPAEAIEVQEIDLSTLLAEMATSAQEEGDEELKRLLSMVNTLQIKGFSLPGDDAATRKAVDRMEKILADDGWARIVHVKDGEETTNISVRHHEDRVVGLTVVTYEPGGDVAFINVTGKLDLGALLSLAKNLDLALDKDVDLENEEVLEEH